MDPTQDAAKRHRAARLRAKEATAQARRDAAHGPAMRARIALLEARLGRLVDAMHLRRHTLTDAERAILDDATDVL